MTSKSVQIQYIIDMKLHEVTLYDGRRGRAGQSGAERGRRCGAENRNICITKRDRNYSWVVNHGNPEKMFPSNVLISLKAEKIPLSLIENPHKSPFRNFFYDHSKVELFSFLCSNLYKRILSITRQRKDATAVAQLKLILNARVSYHKCQTHN